MSVTAEAALEARLAALEASSGDPNANTISQRISALERALRASEAKCENFGELVAAYNELCAECCVEPTSGANGARLLEGLASSLAGHETKRSVLLEAEADTERVAAELEQVSTLEPHVNPPYLQGVAELSRRLAAVEASTATDAASVRAVHGEVVQLLEGYGAMVDALSESLVAWDSVLSAAEAKKREAP